MKPKKLVLYCNRADETEQYAELLKSSAMEMDLLVCRNEEELERKVKSAEIIFGVHLPVSCYEKAEQLMWIQSMWAGVEGLMQANIPDRVLISKPWGVFGRFISSYVFGNLLADYINYKEARANQKARKWLPYRIESLEGKVFGIAGLGDISEDCARIARAFGMKVKALRRSGQAHPLADQCFAPAEMESFLSDLDVLLIALPSTRQTRGMFNRKNLNLLPKEAVLINVGRGALIDDESLVEILEKKKIRGAILDVFNEEPLPEEHPYWRLPNCTLTPHVAGPSLASDVCACFLENYRRYLSNEPLLGLIDRSAGY